MNDQPGAPGSGPDGDGHGDTGRRRFLTRTVAGSGVLLAGAATGSAVSATVRGGGWRVETINVDVALAGETWRDSPVNYGVDAGDLRGQPFAVEGWIYPGGHIPVPGDGFVPSQDGSIGRWLCRGSLLVHLERPEPHVHSTQEFVFGPMTGEQLFADDNLTTSGLEGTFLTDQIARRAVLGGTGRYRGAVGEVRQSRNGYNTSAFADGTGNAPNFRMRFDLLLPDV